ncbi:MAG: hypothetical protein ABIG95_01715 [Candidatus Woesearchaeota archaeon]
MHSSLDQNQAEHLFYHLTAAYKKLDFSRVAPKQIVKSGFIASVGRHTYHIPGCFWVKRIKKRNWIEFSTEAEAKKLGLRRHKCVGPLAGKTLTKKEMAALKRMISAFEAEIKRVKKTKRYNKKRIGILEARLKKSKMKLKKVL